MLIGPVISICLLVVTSIKKRLESVNEGPEDKVFLHPSFLDRGYRTFAREADTVFRS